MQCATYRADDRVATLSESVVNGSGGADVDSVSYDLDPAERTSQVIEKVNGTETTRLRYRYGDSSDSPSAVDTSTDAGSTWTATRNVAMPGLGLVATTSGGTTTDDLSDLHGNVVATIANTSGATVLGSYGESDEYGNVVSGSVSGRYGWLGASERSRDSLAGIVLMGQRAYNPSTGLFLQPDPVAGGGATRYAYPFDPVNMSDVGGLYWGESWVKAVGKAVKFVGEWALVHGLDWGIERVAAYAFCDAAALICAGVVAAIVAAGESMVKDVFGHGFHAKSSIPKAVALGAMAFISAVTVNGLTAHEVERAAVPIRSIGRKLVSFLRDNGHEITADAVVDAYTDLIEDLMDDAIEREEAHHHH